MPYLQYKTNSENIENSNQLLNPYLGWGRGSGTNTLYQVHLELVNQSVCDTQLGGRFDPELMICAGDVENGGRDACGVSY